MRAPVVVFAYNRPDHLEKTLEALSENTGAAQSDIYVFVDGPKNESGTELQQKVKETALSFENRFASMTMTVSEKNKGLAASVISGVTSVIEKYGRVIVVEDDSVSSKEFLSFMNDALEFYEKDKTVWSIGGFTVPIALPDDYSHSVIKTQRVSSYAWAVWKDRWERIDWKVCDYGRFRRSIFLRRGFNRWGEDRASMLDDQMNGRIDSWAIRFDYAMFMNGMYNIIPVHSLIKNIGHDGSGTHIIGDPSGDRFSVELSSDGTPLLPEYVDIDERIRKEYVKPFRLSIGYRAKRYVQNM